MNNVNSNIQQAQDNNRPSPGHFVLVKQSDIDIARQKRLDYFNNNGQSGLNISFPEEFEYYSVALEVCSVDAQGNEKVISYINFPTMPSSLSKSVEYLSTVKKTGSGVFVMRNTSFKPFQISIQGTFGAKLRYVDTQGYLSAPSSATAVTTQQVSVNTTVDQNKLFSQNIKTGYGTLKIVEKMLELAHNSTNDIPNRLYWYNFAFNDMYLVEPIRFSPRQDRSTNGMWQYSLELQALAKAGDIQSNLSNQQKNILSATSLQRSINTTSTAIKSIFKNQSQDLDYDQENSTQSNSRFKRALYKYGNIYKPSLMTTIDTGKFNNRINLFNNG